jgi:hypothetical protein
LQVDLTEREIGKLEELARRADEELKFKSTDPVRKIVDKVLAGKVTTETEEHELILRHKKNGSCAMSWMDDGQLRCSINTLCHRLGAPIQEFKPSPCYVFPIHYDEFTPGHFVLSVLSEETRFWIQQHESVAKLRCLRKPEPGAPSAYIALRGEIEYLLGPDFYLELDRHARKILQDRAA